jgi:hypothetical protein
VEGTALAGFQWRVLRTRLPRLRAAEWIGVRVALAVAGWLVGIEAVALHEVVAGRSEIAQEVSKISKRCSRVEASGWQD